MIVTVFRSRVRPEMKEEYMQLAARMGTLAKEISECGACMPNMLKRRRRDAGIFTSSTVP